MPFNYYSFLTPGWFRKEPTELDKANHTTLFYHRPDEQANVKSCPTQTTAAVLKDRFAILKLRQQHGNLTRSAVKAAVGSNLFFDLLAVLSQAELTPDQQTEGDHRSSFTDLEGYDEAKLARATFFSVITLFPELFEGSQLMAHAIADFGKSIISFTEISFTDRRPLLADAAFSGSANSSEIADKVTQNAASIRNYEGISREEPTTEKHTTTTETGKTSFDAESFNDAYHAWKAEREDLSVLMADHYRLTMISQFVTLFTDEACLAELFDAIPQVIEALPPHTLATLCNTSEKARELLCTKYPEFLACLSLTDLYDLASQHLSIAHAICRDPALYDALKAVETEPALALYRAHSSEDRESLALFSLALRDADPFALRGDLDHAGRFALAQTDQDHWGEFNALFFGKGSACQDNVRFFIEQRQSGGFLPAAFFSEGDHTAEHFKSLLDSAVTESATFSHSKAKVNPDHLLLVLDYLFADKTRAEVFVDCYAAMGVEAIEMGSVRRYPSALVRSMAQGLFYSEYPQQEQLTESDQAGAEPKRPAALDHFLIQHATTLLSPLLSQRLHPDASKEKALMSVYLRRLLTQSEDPKAMLKALRKIGDFKFYTQLAPAAAKLGLDLRAYDKTKATERETFEKGTRYLSETTLTRLKDNQPRLWDRWLAHRFDALLDFYHTPKNTLMTHSITQASEISYTTGFTVSHGIRDFVQEVLTRIVQLVSSSEQADYSFASILAGHLVGHPEALKALLDLAYGNEKALVDRAKQDLPLLQSACDLSVCAAQDKPLSETHPLLNPVGFVDRMIEIANDPRQDYNAEEHRFLECIANTPHLWAQVDPAGWWTGKATRVAELRLIPVFDAKLPADTVKKSAASGDSVVSSDSDDEMERIPKKPGLFSRAKASLRRLWKGDSKKRRKDGSRESRRDSQDDGLFDDDLRHHDLSVEAVNAWLLGGADSPLTSDNLQEFVRFRENDQLYPLMGNHIEHAVLSNNDVAFTAWTCLLARCATWLSSNEQLNTPFITAYQRAIEAGVITHETVKAAVREETRQVDDDFFAAYEARQTPSNNAPSTGDPLGTGAFNARRDDTNRAASTIIRARAAAGSRTLPPPPAYTASTGNSGSPTPGHQGGADAL